MDSVIDLDRFEELDPADQSERSWLGRYSGGIAMVGVLALLFLLGGGGVSAEGLFRHTTIQARSSSGFQLVGATVYLREKSDDAIAAYSMEGKLRWRAKVRFPSKGGTIIGNDDVVLVSEESAGVPKTVALDARTGARLWKENGRPFTTSASAGLAVVVIEQVDQGRGAVFEPPGVVTGLDLRTGRVRWSYGIGMSTGRTSALIVEIDSPLVITSVAMIIFDQLDGDRLIDFSTGTERGSGDLDRFLVGNFTVRFDEVLVSVVPQDPSENPRPDGGGSPGRQSFGAPPGTRWNLWAYRADTLRSTWRTLLDAGLFVMKPCGILICTATAGQVRALDPATGEIRWQAPWSYVGGPAEHAVAVTEEPEPGTEPGTQVGVIDTDTGRTLLTVGQWRPVSSIDQPWVALVRKAPDQSEREALRTEVAVLDRDGLREIRVGEFFGKGTDCQANDAHIVCRTSAGDLTVWRYRPTSL